MLQRERETGEGDRMGVNWDPNRYQTCVVCGRPSDGKAICRDERCARELAES